MVLSSHPIYLLILNHFCCRLISTSPSPWLREGGFANTAAAHTPNDPLWLRLGGLDLFVHGIAGEAELVECQRSHPVGGAHVLGVPHVALDFRYA